MLGRGTRSPQDRRNKRAAIKKAALSSKLSLVSGVTQSSSGSSGSGSTVTQESISRSRTKASKGIVSSKGKKQKPTAKGTAAKQSDSPRKGKGAIDVFAFLDKDQSRASLVQKQSNKPPVDIRDASKYPLHDDSDGESDPRSFHSDSGISIDDTSSEQSCSKINKVFGTRLGTVEEEPVSGYFRPSYAEHRHHPKLQPIPQDIDEEHPECYYRTDDVRNEPDIASASGSEETSGLAEEPTSSGYDLLASRLCSSQEPSEDSLPPLYRRFERLNHRILLQLQDEIAEMEEDLQFMDQVDAHERAAHRGQAAPASRRLDWQWRGNELHGRRLEMLGRIYLKVEQYSKSWNHKFA